MNCMAVRFGSLLYISNALIWSYLAIAIWWVDFPGGAVVLTTDGRLEMDLVMRMGVNR